MSEIRVAAVGDLHCTRKSQGAYQHLFRKMSREADVLVMCGDLTDYGLPEEAQILASEIGHGLTIPAVAVLGNHDYESDHVHELRNILLAAGVTVLDGDSCEIDGVGFAGVKGFCGGFGDHAVAAWGEHTLKVFVQEAVHEALKLEESLSRLRCPTRLAVLHYAPIEATVVGEAPEIYPFLGSRRLEEAINRAGAAAVFHGHCHSGSLEGRTVTGIPVYNVAMPLLKRKLPEQPSFRVLTLPRGEERRQTTA